MAPELGVCDSWADNCPEMVLRYCASSAEVNKFSLHRQTRKEERSPATAAQVTLGWCFVLSSSMVGCLWVGSQGGRRRRAVGVSSTGTSL
jgi:hypothetical protein